MEKRDIKSYYLITIVLRQDSWQTSEMYCRWNFFFILTIVTLFIVQIGCRIWKKVATKKWRTRPPTKRTRAEELSRAIWRDCSRPIFLAYLADGAKCKYRCPKKGEEKGPRNLIRRSDNEIVSQCIYSHFQPIPGRDKAASTFTAEHLGIILSLWIC